MGLHARTYRFLVTPLDWGLGHATRCVPVIRALRERGHEVIIAARGAPGQVLAEEFPDLKVVPITNYGITYSSNLAGFYAKLPWIAFRALRCAARERHDVGRLVREHHIDCIISDNRFGAHVRGVPSVYITHQLCLRLPAAFRWLSYAAYKVHQSIMAPFDRVWIPDMPGPGSLTGALSGEYRPLAKARYVGPLSRFAGNPPAETREDPLDLLVMISGPEPQRTLLEEAIARQIASFEGRALVVCGRPGTHQEQHVTGTTTFVSHLPPARINAVLRSARAIVCRGGYTTIMELVSLNRTAVLIPTPGQTEQEFLCDRMAQMGRAVARPQRRFELHESLKALRALPAPAPLETGELLGAAVEELESMLKDQSKRNTEHTECTEFRG
jgi:uncharacterized protein (TIGR00661 family)